jgi:hypothetical protein
LNPVFRQGFARLRRDRARALLTFGGVAAAAAMVGASATLVFALATGFERSAGRAHLPDVTARFAEQPIGLVESRVRTLPNVRAAAYLFEANAIGVQAGSN